MEEKITLFTAMMDAVVEFIDSGREASTPHSDRPNPKTLNIAS